MSGLGVVGVAADAEAAYRELLRRPELGRVDHTGPGAALAARLGWDAPRTAAALDALSRTGLVRAGAGGGVLPVRPDVAVEALLVAEQESLAARTRALAATRADLDVLLADWRRGREREQPRVEVEVLDDLPAIRQRLRELGAGVRHDLRVCGTGIQEDAQMIEEQMAEDAPLLERGVRVRSLYGSYVAQLPVFWAGARQGVERGEQVRLEDDLPPRFLVYDDDAVVAPLDPDDPDRGALLVTSPAVVRAYTALFERLWAGATDPFGAGGDPGLGERERRLLELLGAGAKDEAVARHLGLGLRTVRRAVADLMDELSASTRFQAGVRAARRGWV